MPQLQSVDHLIADCQPDKREPAVRKSPPRQTTTIILATTKTMTTTTTLCVIPQFITWATATRSRKVFWKKTKKTMRTSSCMTTGFTVRPPQLHPAEQAHLLERGSCSYDRNDKS
ncbi:hypothetical protein AVEN_157120-1 [Araneus ventricosus]|uniref:Uncharacterized protein n=1 Tax=Araneus ventricosus TaxID=182803 RepID=A0A4Y2SBE2_ARAVE|nr:hypothetical protein AVEN_157120-1 [Araneus ventricosus]